MIELIKNKLTAAKINTHYLNRYISIISSSEKDKQSKFIERHHILPKSIFPEHKNDKWNIVKLSPRKHLVAHLLLFYMFHKKGPMQTALWFMVHTRDTKRINSRVYQRLKEEFSYRTSYVMSKNMKGKATFIDNSGVKYHLDVTDPLIEKLSLVHLSTNMSNYVDKETNETFYLHKDSELISERNLVHINKGRKVTEEHKRKLAGKVAVKDKKGKTFSVSVDDKRYKSGELVQANSGKVNVVIDGKIKKVTSEEFKTGKYEHQNKNKVDVILSDGTITKIDKNDERLKTGEAKIYTSELSREISRKVITEYNKSCKGKVWLTSPDGKEKQFSPDEVESLIKVGYVKGRKSTKFPSQKGKNVGAKTCNNGIQEKRYYGDNLPEGFVHGHLKKAWINKDGKSKLIRFSKLQEFLINGWNQGRI